MANTRARTSDILHKDQRLDEVVTGLLKDDSTLFRETQANHMEINKINSTLQYVDTNENDVLTVHAKHDGLANMALQSADTHHRWTITSWNDGAFQFRYGDDAAVSNHIFTMSNTGVWCERPSHFNQLITANKGLVVNGGNFDMGKGYSVLTDGGECLLRSTQNPDGSWPTVTPAFKLILTNRVSPVGQSGMTMGFNLNENVGVDSYILMFLEGAFGVKHWLYNQEGKSFCPAGGGWFVSSDITMKYNFKDVNDSILEKLATLDTFTYGWKDANILHRSAGLSAQQVREIAPECVTEVKGKLAVDYASFCASYHTAGIQELHAYIQLLLAEVDDLKGRLEVLEAQPKIMLM